MSLTQPFPHCEGGTLRSCPGVQNTTLRYHTQTLDHFNWQNHTNLPAGTFRQRVFTHTQWWKKKQPIFFYFGNEDDVELYVNHTGIMWEAARPFGAALVFAEHRYYGQSLPFSPGAKDCMQFLTTEQAMADFAEVIYALRDEWDAWDSKVIGFGGSYGGMLAAWFRLKYPNAVDGVLAASAPIWSFVGLDPPYSYGAFMARVTRDATSAGGARDGCAANVKRVFQQLAAAATTADGRATVAKGFNLCTVPRDAADVDLVRQWFEAPWGSLAMGDFPYASTYLMHGKSLLPPWPMRAACQPLGGVLPTDGELFAGARQAGAVFHNASGNAGVCWNITGQPSTRGGALARLQPRFHPARRPTMRSPVAASALFADDGARDVADDTAGPAACKGDWGYQWCTEMVQPFTQGVDGSDMFWPYAPYNYTASARSCVSTWGVTPREQWARIGLGGKRIADASNIIFSNGAYDPWSPGGVHTKLNPSIHPILIPSGAHHIDLMFSDPADPPDVTNVRQTELKIIKGWLGNSE